MAWPCLAITGDVAIVYNRNAGIDDRGNGFFASKNKCKMTGYFTVSWADTTCLSGGPQHYQKNPLVISFPVKA